MSFKLPIETVGVGAYLKQERQERNIPLSEVAEKTRVRTYYLEKIEAEEFDQLPSIPVGRGFVRSYAKCVGIDPEQVVLFYNRCVGHRSEDMDGQLGSKIPYSKADAGEKEKNLLFPVVAVFLFILVSGALLWLAQGRTESIGQWTGFISQEKSKLVNEANSQNPNSKEKAGDKGEMKPVSSAPSNEKDSGTQKPKALSQMPDSEAKAGTNSPAVTKAPELGDRDENAPSTSSISTGIDSDFSMPRTPPSPRLNLSIRAVEDTWLRVVVDQKEATEIYLTKGSEKIWPANDRIMLTVGNVAGTRVFLNGVSLSLPKTASNVVRDFVITDKVAELETEFAEN